MPAVTAKIDMTARVAGPARQTRSFGSRIGSPLSSGNQAGGFPEIGNRLCRSSYAEQMPGVAVVTDSTSSLDPADAARADVSIIPLQVVIDDLSRPESDVGPQEVAGALRAGRRVSTSRPTPDMIKNTYAELAAAGRDAIVSVHLSSKISGTCSAAQV